MRKENWKKEKTNKQTNKQTQNSEELQKPNIEADVYNKNKKCD